MTFVIQNWEKVNRLSWFPDCHIVHLLKIGQKCVLVVLQLIGVDYNCLTKYQCLQRFFALKNRNWLQVFYGLF